jgi:hypothetical protein
VELSKSILAAATFRTVDVSIGQDTIRVRELSARDGIEFGRLANLTAQALDAHGEGSPEQALANLNMLQFAVVASVVDENNRRVFATESDRATVEDIPIEVVAEIATAAIEITYPGDGDAQGKAA